MNVVTALPSLSWSRISTYSDCGRKYELRYVEKVPEAPSGWFIGGRAIHAAIAEGYEMGWFDDLAIDEDHPVWTSYLIALNREIAEAGDVPISWGGRKTREFPAGEDYAWWSHAPAMSMLRQAHAQIMEDAKAGTTLFGGGVEIAVHADVAGARMLAYVDRISVTSEGEPLVDDYKTGRPGGGSPMQLAIYASNAHATLGLDVTRGRFVYLRASDRTRRVQWVDLAPLVPLVETFARQTISGIEAGTFPMNPSSYCSSCSVREHCAYGQTIQPKEPTQ